MAHGEALMTMNGLTRTEEHRGASGASAVMPAMSSSGAAKSSAASAAHVVIDCKIKKLYYGAFLAVRDTDISVSSNDITAFIGPSGCGKSTVLRCLNRMNDFIEGFRLDGAVHFQGQDIYAESIDPVAVRRSIGMVFQQPNPFAMSIKKNVAFGLELNRFKGNHEERIEQALRSAALWDEVKDKLNDNGLSLSGGQQQRLCIARAIAVEPELLLMDEPCSALDPIATRKIEELMLELKKKYTIAIVTHNLQQAQRVADQTAFFFVDTSAGGRTGYLIEHRKTDELFGDPREDRTKEYIRGEFS
jgi:phosphate transport system ATP-binding protein